MASELNDYLKAIQTEKEENLLPGVIKKDVTVLGVTGTYEGSGGGSGDVKLFETEEAMQSDASAEDGDLAIVYKGALGYMSETSQFQVMSFPQTVVLDEALSGNAHINLEPVDETQHMDIMVSLGNEYFEVDCWGGELSMRVYYTSEDGLTYTRQDSGEETYDLGVLVHKDPNNGMWNDAIGKFIRIPSYEYKGLFEYNFKADADYVKGFKDWVTYNEYTECVIPNVSKICKIVRKIVADYDEYYVIGLYTYSSANTVDIYTVGTQDTKGFRFVGVPSITIDGNNLRILSRYYNSTTPSRLNKITLNLETETYTITPLSIIGTYNDMDYMATLPVSQPITFLDIRADALFYTYTQYNKTSSDYVRISSTIGSIYKYRPANSQLNATKENVFNGQIFNGMNGVETGTLASVATINCNTSNGKVMGRLLAQFNDMTPVKINKDNYWTYIPRDTYIIPTKYDGTPLVDFGDLTEPPNVANGWLQDRGLLQYVPKINTSNMTSMKNMFYSAGSIVYIADLDTRKSTNFVSMFENCESLVKAPNMDTSNGTDFTRTFYNCRDLVEIPIYDFSSATVMNNTFYLCQSLITAPSIDFHTVPDVTGLFQGCKNMENVPVFNASSVKKFKNMYDYCQKLSNTALNNILSMCATMSGSTTDTKTLKNLGLTSTQASTCTSLSNWSSAQSAGWTTGY